jgi:hypothetical protein
MAFLWFRRRSVLCMSFCAFFVLHTLAIAQPLTLGSSTSSQYVFHKGNCAELAQVPGQKGWFTVLRQVACDKKAVQSILKPRFREKLQLAGWPNSEWDNVMKVADCESGWNNKARNPYNPNVRGLLQIDVEEHKVLIRALEYRESDMLETVPNLRVGFFLFQKDRWAPWKATHYCHLLS